MNTLPNKFSKVPVYVLLVLVGLIVMGLAPASAYASEVLDAKGIVADFDLSQPVDQKEIITLENGTTAELGVRYIPSLIPQWDSYYEDASGDWEVYYDSPIVSRRFYITISDHRIVRGHSPSYTTFLCTVTSEDFSWGSTVATYRLGINSFDLVSTVAVLQAMMEGSTLHTYAN